MRQRVASDSSPGGVIQVAHAGRWGAVPEALLEDSALSLDARAVAAWLSVKAHGWEIRIAFLRRAVGGPGRPLGKDKWLRIARELEDGGYFSRTRERGDGGQWVWRIVFTPIPTMVGFANHGSPGDGSPVPGEPDHITTPTSTSPVLTTPQQHSDGRSEELIYPILRESERSAVDKLLDSCPEYLHQQLLDELAGAMHRKKIKSGLIPYMRALMRAANQGSFYPSLGLDVQASREAASSIKQPKDTFVPDAKAQASGEKLIAAVRQRVQRHG